ncbi:RNA-binding S4 domain-containing protein [Pseudoruegeria sp. SK021]|uniref:RNA-binding S4 domain-containing protein n=1 Tax=Pseudoruegeria sp. SK021 TaxID=1933035 RepID=UPI000A251A50|nr:RNA-binding S4 domain-containing protein [Pseudoruegeria sp. SK021]OSP55274.1 hypothetical protein BV911_08605 [Pseudoruegeria sp. SK021]
MTDSSGIPSMRIDKWLWHARFFKTRGRASEIAGSGGLRVNGARISKPAHLVRVGDVLTFQQERQTRIVEITRMTERRGPAPEAQSAYIDCSPEPVHDPGAPQSLPGRPDKKQRRQARQSGLGRLE